ncbi:MAG: sugar-specific transcriptional regulator TrmB [Candidatus Latescibacterota bacterium]|jgi:sugar-specific transcriptional regulator TrmB
MVVNNDIFQLLSSFGLSDYEARSYVGLLGCQPATAYEVARTAGIPTSKIYETINRLLDKSLAQPVSAKKGRGQQYMALSVEDFIRLKQQETMRNTERLGPLLKTLNNGADTDFVWQLDTADQVLDKTRQLIGQAENELLVSLWPEELELLREDLVQAENRGVRIALVHFGKPQISIGATFHHPAEETLHAEKGGRSLTLVVDSKSVVIATYLDNGRTEGAWSRNRAFVLVAEDYVRHDVYTTKLTAAMDAEIKRFFGDDYAALRDVFSP